MNNYVSDFETTTDENDCRVWAWGLMNLYDFDDYKMNLTIDSFMEKCESLKNSTIWFHNLKFDGNFILSWLLENGYEYSEEKNDKTFNTIISQMGTFYQIEVIFKKYKKRYVKVVFKDSLKKIPFSVDEISKAFKFDVMKLEIDYNKKREKYYQPTEEEKEYLKHDILIVATALKSQFEMQLKKMTTGSDALNSFKEIYNKEQFKYDFPILEIDVDNDIRRAYRGGWTYVNKRFKNKTVGEGIVFDVNSLYPSVMKKDLLPYGFPLFFEGKYKENKKYPLYIQHILCEFTIKKDMLPTIQCKSFMYAQHQYISQSKGITELYLTNVDLELFLKHYNVRNIEYLNGYMFMGARGMFDDYINKWGKIKEENTGMIRGWAKLMLNSLYGKFATNPDVTMKIPYLSDDKIVKFKNSETKLRDPVYTAMSVFITSYARLKTITTAQNNYKRFIYADTDSIHLLHKTIPDIPIHKSELGFWKQENTFERARFIRAKTYIEDSKELGLIVRCASMPANVKKYVTFDNFKYGFNTNDYNVSKLRHKNVRGGVILVDTPFEIKK